MEFGYQFIDPISKLASRKWYWLDTALVPEIIYHEYAHAALSDHLELSHNSAVVEGMADFFAGQISGSPKLAKHIKKHNTFNGKNAKKKQDYMIQFEMGQYANTDFVFGLLWSMKKILGEKEGESFIFDLRKNINANSNIRSGLVEGLIETCEVSCKSPFTDKIKILKQLNSKGL
jgi:predicted sulfurtransferase